MLGTNFYVDFISKYICKQVRVLSSINSIEILGCASKVKKIFSSRNASFVTVTIYETTDNAVKNHYFCVIFSQYFETKFSITTMMM